MNLESHGLDISPHMLRKTRKKLREHGLPDANKRLKRCDVRNIASAFKNKFHAILAAYSLDFPLDLQVFRQSIQIVSDALEDDAMLVMCISHPTAHPQYPRLINDTMRTSEGALDDVWVDVAGKLIVVDNKSTST